MNLLRFGDIKVSLLKTRRLVSIGLMFIPFTSVKVLLRSSFERLKKEEEKKASSIFMHMSIKNLAMLNFASKNGFKFARYLEEFWEKGTNDAYLLAKEI